MSNQSGIDPVEYKVLVLPDPVEEVSKGGIVLSVESVKERERMAQVKGTLVAVGGNAFEDWNSKPEPGNRVMIAKYAGVVAPGADGKEYRLCNDKDICAVITVE